MGRWGDVLTSAIVRSVAHGQLLLWHGSFGMTFEQQMEQFSLAHIRAVAARAGYQVTRDETDTGLDGTLRGDGPGRPRIDFQAKSTSVDIR